MHFKKEEFTLDGIDQTTYYLKMSQRVKRYMKENYNEYDVTSYHRISYDIITHECILYRKRRLVDDSVNLRNDPILIDVANAIHEFTTEDNSMGLYILKLLRRKNLTIKTFAMKTTIKEPELRRYVNGSRKPSSMSIRKMAEGFDMTVSEFLLFNTVDESDPFQKICQMINENREALSPKEKLQLINLLSR